jgi:TonB family protein
LKFTVTMLGDIRDITVAKPVHPLLDKEAIRVVKEMPRWKPGRQNGQYVNVYYNLPIKFALQ